MRWNNVFTLSLQQSKNEKQDLSLYPIKRHFCITEITVDEYAGF